VPLNGLRAMLVMMIASGSEMKYLGHDHLWFGWLMFTLALVGLYAISERYADVGAPDLRTEQPQVDAASRGSSIAAAAVAIALLLVGPTLSPRAVSDVRESAAIVAPPIPGCSLAPTESAPFVASFLAPEMALHAVYVCGAVKVSVDVARYLHQEPGREAADDRNEIVSRKWVKDQSYVARSVGPDWSVRESRYDRGPQDAVVWTWYAVGDVAAGSTYDAKLQETMNALLLRQVETAVFAVTAWTSDAAAAQATLKAVSEGVRSWYRSQI
jgi:EpsI family protein